VCSSDLIMGYGVSEGFQFLVRFLQLSCTFGDPSLQFVVKLFDFPFRAYPFSNVAECRYSAAHDTVLIFQRTTTNFYPTAPRQSGIAHKYLRKADFSVKCTN